MTMTETEIVKDFREAKDKRMQVGILADLNECSKEKIIEILKAGGVDHRELPRTRKPKEEATFEKKKAFSLQSDTDEETNAKLEPLIREALLFYRKQLETEKEEGMRQIELVKQLLSEHETSIRLLNEGIARIDYLTGEAEHEQTETDRT